MAQVNILRQSALAAMVALAIGKGLALLSWTALVALAGSELQSKEYGLFLLLSNLAALVVVLGGFGQPQVLLYRNGRLGTTTRSTVHHANLMTAFWVLMRMTLVGTALASTILMLWVDLKYGLLAAWCVWTICSSWQTLMAEEARSVSCMWTAGLAGNSAAAGGAAVLAIALLVVVILHNLSWRLDLGLIMLALALASIASSIWLLTNYLLDRNRHTSLPLDAVEADSTESQKGIWHSGALVTINTLLTFVIGQSDLWWVSLCYGIEAAGSYGTAAYFARFCSLLSILFAGAFVGRFAALLVKGETQKVAQEVRILSLLAAAAGVFIWGGLALAHEMGLLVKWFHLGATGSFEAFLVLGACHVLGSLFGFGPVVLASAGRFKDLLAITGLSAMLTVVFSAVAVNTSGLGGLGAAFGLSYLSFVYGCHWQCCRVLGISPYDLRRTL